MKTLHLLVVALLAALVLGCLCMAAVWIGNPIVGPGWIKRAFVACLLLGALRVSSRPVGITTFRGDSYYLTCTAFCIGLVLFVLSFLCPTEVKVAALFLIVASIAAMLVRGNLYELAPAPVPQNRGTPMWTLMNREPENAQIYIGPAPAPVYKVILVRVTVEDREPEPTPLPRDVATLLVTDLRKSARREEAIVDDPIHVG